MKKLMIVMTALAATAAFAASGRKSSQIQPGAGSDTVETSGKDARVLIDQYPKLGTQCLLPAPNLSNGGTNLGQCYTGKPRMWTVLESKYTTFSKCLSQLTFTWHVLLDTSKASNKDKEALKKLAPYSYFSTSVTYYNIPRGSHAACVCLHPSYREVYGEAVAVALVVSNENGEILAGDTVTTMPKFFRKKDGYKFWEDSAIMDAKTPAGDPMIERRQGLLDRSKTIWALVNPNDYELTMQ